MSKAKWKDVGELSLILAMVCLFLWALVTMSGCMGGGGGLKKAEDTTSWLWGLFSAGGDTTDEGGGSILDQVNTKVLLPGIAFWFFATSVGLLLALLTHIGTKLLIAGIAGFGLTLGLIITVSLIQSLWWALLIVAFGLLVWFGIMMRRKLAQSAVVRAFLNPNMAQQDRLTLVKKAEKVLKVSIHNGGDVIEFGRKKVKLRRKKT